MPYTKLPNAIYDYLRSQTITPAQALVYSIMIRYHNDNYGFANLTVNEVAYEAGVSEQTARDSINHLVKCGLLTKQPSPIGYRNNVYRALRPLESAEFNRKFPGADDRKKERWAESESRMKRPSIGRRSNLAI